MSTLASAHRLVVVTGASSGIGAAAVRAFCAAGYPVLALARRKPRLDALVAEILGAGDLAGADPGESQSAGAAESAMRMRISPLAIQLDVTDGAAFKKAIADAEAHFGVETGCLVNNAGCMLLGDVVDQDPREWSQMLNVNVFGVLNGIQAVLAGMIARKSGTVINVSSIAGFKAFPSHAAYCASKFAVHGLTETIRQETAKHGLRHILISPGVCSTELLSHTSSDDIKDGYEAWKKEMGAPLVPKDVAGVILFAYEQPQHVCLREIVVGPTFQDQ